MRKAWTRIKAGALWVWNHRTKVLGLAAVGVAYVQNNLAQLGHLIPDRFAGAILAGFGVAAFILGLYNTFANADAPPES